MNIWDIIILTIIALMLIGAGYLSFGRKKGGGCCGDCGKCKECNKQDTTK